MTEVLGEALVYHVISTGKSIRLSVNYQRSNNTGRNATNRPNAILRKCNKKGNKCNNKCTTGNKCNSQCDNHQKRILPQMCFHVSSFMTWPSTQPPNRSVAWAWSNANWEMQTNNGCAFFTSLADFPLDQPVS